jgi:hypothetical protein
MNSETPSIEDLRLLAAAGYEWAQNALIAEFLTLNQDLHASVGDRLEFRADKDELRMNLRIGEDTSINDIRRDWHMIAEFRRRLTAWQGSRRGLGSGSMLELLIDLRKGGWSYARIAEAANRAVVEMLRVALAEPSAGGNWFGEVLARRLLWDLGLKVNEVEVWCDSIMVALRNGGPPFPPGGGPVDRDRIREFFRYRRRRRR